ncbi:MAG: TIGR03960 family B12-binding radical SAM protein [Clostridia bacterium]|nr:TIGR03960 family B12-binding radical SAM protein [Clostridia bacterium]MDY4083344.1 TIGR03960 family B12-binding radical SAM protein [Eubacteriales bacterium]
MTPRELSSILLRVEKPARYVGGEYNMPDMDKPCRHRTCLCFSDKYEVGMSNIGVRILYHMLNDMEGFICERSFAPDLDMAQELKSRGQRLFSLETKRDIVDFDLIGFSVQFELQYTNIPYMFELAGIPLYAKDRPEDFPPVVAGGPCAVNPMPFAPFFDAILIGDGEITFKQINELHLKCLEQGLSKSEFLRLATEIDGVYVPSIGNRTKRAVVQNLDEAYFPTSVLVPNCDIVHDRSTIELFRGCANGCRFCQACFFYRPIRERKPDTLVRYATELMDNTGYDELSLCSLSTSDYSHLKEMVDGIKEQADKRKVKLALPSLRLDSFEAEIYEETSGSSLTFAPEAGTQRLRNVINKNISEQDIYNSIKGAMEHGVKNVKLYFMIGLPTETDEDLQGIVDIVYLVKDLHRQYGKSKLINIVVSTAVFIPKPLTPFQWERQITIEEMKHKQDFLKEKLRIKNVKYSWHGAESSVIEALLARGDESLARVIEEAYKQGAVFDSWSEHFHYEYWLKAIEKCNIVVEDFVGEQAEDKDFCWDIVDNGVTKAYLLAERHKSRQGVTTPNCMGKCNGCGASKLGRCFK